MDTYEEQNRATSPGPRPTILPFPSSSAYLQGYTNFGHEFDEEDEEEEEDSVMRRSTTTTAAECDYEEDDSEDGGLDGPYRYEDEEEDDEENEYDTEDYSAYSDFSVEELHEFMLQQQQQSLLEYACSARRYSLLETIQEETVEELLESRSEVSDYSGVWCWGDDFTDGAESVIYVENPRDVEEEDRDVDEEEEWDLVKAFDSDNEWNQLKAFDRETTDAADIRLDCEPNIFNYNINNAKCHSIKLREDENDDVSPFSSWSDPSDREGSWLDFEEPSDFPSWKCSPEEESSPKRRTHGQSPDNNGQSRTNNEPASEHKTRKHLMSNEPETSQTNLQINKGTEENAAANSATICRTSSNEDDIYSDNDLQLNMATKLKLGSTTEWHAKDQRASFKSISTNTATLMEVSYIKTVLQESLCGNITNGGIRSIACPSKSNPDLTEDEGDRDLLIVFDADENDEPLQTNVVPPQKGNNEYLQVEAETFAEDVPECLSWSDAIDAYLMSLAIEPSSANEHVKHPLPKECSEPRSSGVGLDQSDIKNLVTISNVATVEQKTNVQWESCNRSSILNTDLPMDSTMISTEIEEASTTNKVVRTSVPHARICTLESPSSLMCGDGAMVDFDHLGLERTAGDGAEEQQQPICLKTVAASIDTTDDGHFFTNTPTTRKGSVAIHRLMGTKSAPDLFDVQIMREGQVHVSNITHHEGDFGYDQFGFSSLTDDDFASRSQSEPCVNSLGDCQDIDGLSASPTSPMKSKNFGDFDFVYGGDLTTSSSLKHGRKPFGFDLDSNDDLSASVHRLIFKERSTFSFSSKSFDSQFTSSEDESSNSSSDIDDDQNHLGTGHNSGSLSRTRVLFPRFTPPGTLRSFRSFNALNLAGKEEEQEEEEQLDVGVSGCTTCINEIEESQILNSSHLVPNGHSWMDGIEEESSELEGEKIRPSSEDLSEDSGYSDIRGSCNTLSVPHPVAEEEESEEDISGTSRQRLKKLLFNDTERRDRTLCLSTGSGQNLGQTDEISSTTISALNEVALSVHDPDHSEEENLQKDESVVSMTTPIMRKLEQLSESKMQKAEEKGAKLIALDHTHLQVYEQMLENEHHHQVNKDQSGTFVSLKSEHPSSQDYSFSGTKMKQTFTCDEEYKCGKQTVDSNTEEEEIKLVEASKENVKVISDTEWNVEVIIGKGSCPTTLIHPPQKERMGVEREGRDATLPRPTEHRETETESSILVSTSISKNNLVGCERAFSCIENHLTASNCGSTQTVNPFHPLDYPKDKEQTEGPPEGVYQTLAHIPTGQQCDSWKQSSHFVSHISSVSYCESDNRSGAELNTNDKHTPDSVCSQSDWFQVGSVSNGYEDDVQTTAQLVVVSTNSNNLSDKPQTTTTTVELKLPINTSVVGAPCQGEPVLEPCTPTPSTKEGEDHKKQILQVPKQRGSVTVRVILKRIDPLPKKEDTLHLVEPFGYICGDVDESRSNDTSSISEKKTVVALNRTLEVQQSTSLSEHDSHSKTTSEARIQTEFLLATNEEQTLEASVGVFDTTNCNLGQSDPPKLHETEQQKAFATKNIANSGPELMLNQCEATASEQVFNSTSDLFSESTSPQLKHAEDANDKVPFKQPQLGIKQSWMQLERTEANKKTVKEVVHQPEDQQMENNNNVSCHQQWTTSYPRNGHHNKDTINNNNNKVKVTQEEEEEEAGPFKAVVCTLEQETPTRPPRHHPVKVNIVPGSVAMDAKPPLPPSVTNQTLARHLAPCRTKIINARQQFFNRDSEVQQACSGDRDTVEETGREQIDETLEKFRQRAKEGRDRVAKSVSDLHQIERAFRENPVPPTLTSTPATYQPKIIDRAQDSSNQWDATYNHSKSITNAEKSTATTARDFIDGYDSDAFFCIQLQRNAKPKNNENGDLSEQSDGYLNGKNHEGSENSPPKRPPRRTDVGSTATPQRSNSQTSSSPLHQSGWNSRERSPSIGYLETDIDTLHSREVIRICDFEDTADQNNVGGQPSRPSRHNSPSGKPPRPPSHHLKTRSMFNLMEGTESNGGHTKSTPSYETQLSNTTADSDDPVDDITSRAKSMEFLLKDENKLSVLPPENQLQQMKGSFLAAETGSTEDGSRAMSEHELRIRRSLQKLNLPEWYKNSPLGQMGSTEGLLLRRQQRHTAGHPTTTRWEDLRSKSTSATSLGGAGVGPSLQRHSVSSTGKNVVIHKRVTTPDWRYVKSSRESLLQSPMSPSPSPSLTDRSFQYYYNSTAISRWSSSRLSSTTASSRSTSPTGSAQCRSPFQRQPYLGWRSSERLTRERTNSGTDNSNSSTPTHGFYRSAAERLSQGPGYYALRFGLYRSPGSDGNLLHGGGRRGSNSSSTTAPNNEMTTKSSPTADRIPNYQANHPEITVNVFEPNGYSEDTGSREGSPPEHVRVAAELVREIDKMISRNNNSNNEQGIENGRGQLLDPEMDITPLERIRHPSPIEVRAVEVDPNSANSSPKSTGSGKQQKVIWVESSFVGVRPVRVTDTPTEESAPKEAPPPSLVYQDAPTSPLLNQVAEEILTNERRLSLTSTTLEEVLDSLLALPSSSQSPSPSGYRTGRWDTDDTSTARKAQEQIKEQHTLQKPLSNNDPVSPFEPSAPPCPEEEQHQSSSGGSSQGTGGCSSSSSGSVSSRSSEPSSNRVVKTEISSSSSTDLTTATTTVESSSASSIRGTESSSSADIMSSSGNSQTSSMSGSSSGKEVIPPPPGFLDHASKSSLLSTASSRSSCSASEGVTTSSASPLARTTIASSYKHPTIGPLHEIEDENLSESSYTPSSERFVHDDDSFPPPPTHHELMQLVEQEEHSVETHVKKDFEEHDQMCDSRRHSISTELSLSNIMQETSADEALTEDEPPLTPADPDDDELGDRKLSGGRQDQLDDTVIVRCSHHRCNNTAELRDARKYYKTCHNCYTYYCSRECRKSHWDKHRHVCMYGRIRSMCKQAIQYARDNPNILNHLSRLARTGYLTQGRGFVKILFRNTDLAMHFLRHGWSQLEDGPIYVSWKDLLPQEMGAEVYRAVLDLSKHYDPDLKFVLLVAVFITREVPMQSVPHWEREIIAKCAKVPLAKSIISKDGHSFMHDDPNTMILTGPNPPKGGDFASMRLSREVCLATIEERLKERGVSLRHQFPEVYQRLCVYVDKDDPFPPLTIYPKDGLTGQTFMCVIMPNCGPQLQDWWMSPSTAKK